MTRLPRSAAAQVCSFIRSVVACHPRWRGPTLNARQWRRRVLAEKGELMAPETTDLTGLPVIPAARKARCPLEPPAEFADWRNAGGLQLAQWRGNPTWVGSRYDDIKAALVDPRLSADTIPDSMKTSPRDDMPVIFPRIDDPEHNRLRRMMTRDFTFRPAEAMRPQIQELVDGFIDEMIESGPPADLVRDYALPVPSLVISLLLGVPYQD